ncbi:hypothetical protein L596_027750 [Steinernema carpocapsae]|uniref:Uncharacterized protein n=1 Tax=Steinernema carpocapsae TaxID=34508 RepID=A0A4U5LWE3_STECR|nr:hypothetical protein L596_027750 [Steinernema carpocapsae]
MIDLPRFSAFVLASDLSPFQLIAVFQLLPLHPSLNEFPESSLFLLPTPNQISSFAKIIVSRIGRQFRILVQAMMRMDVATPRLVVFGVLWNECFMMVTKLGLGTASECKMS